MMGDLAACVVFGKRATFTDDRVCATCRDEAHKKKAGK